MGAMSAFVASGGKNENKTGGPSAIAFAGAPIESDEPVYNKAKHVKSGPDGSFKVALPLGKYWVGMKEVALDPIFFSQG
jgi:hypothetical protein